MPKKSMYWPLTCLLPFTVASSSLLAENLNSSPQNDRVFASKTYFLMAVDNEIGFNIQEQDVPTLLGVSEMDKEDSETIYFGMRKAMLKYAARTWDAGIAASYGKEVGRVIGWHTMDIETDPAVEQVRNKLLLFRYAQQYRSSNALIEKYHQYLDRDAAKIQANSVDFISHCEPLEPHSEFAFYQTLGSVLPKGNRAFMMAFHFETLAPCQKMELGQWLDQHGSSLSTSDLQKALNEFGNNSSN